MNLRSLTWRDPSVAVTAVIAVAVLLRLWGIAFGLPYDFTPDELHEIVRALKLGAGEYSWTPGKGGLYLILFVEYGLLYVWWWLTGAVENPTDFAVRYLQDAGPFYLAGRITVALMGAATCWLLYRLARKLYDFNTAMVTTVIAATAYYHAMWSHFVNVDIGMTLFMWAGILTYIHYESTEKLRWLILAGALIGISFAFKFPGIVALFPIGIAMLFPLSNWRRQLQAIRRGALLLLAVVATSAAVAPENVAGIGNVANDFSAILFSNDADDAFPTDNDITAEQAFVDAVQDVTIFTGPDYLQVILRPHNLVLTLLAALGAAMAVWTRNRWDLIWAALIVTFLAVMSFSDRPGEERYILPILPAMWLLSSRAITHFAKGRPLVQSTLVALLIAYPLVKLIKQNYTWTQPDTRILAKAWIEANVDPDAKILMDGMRYRFIQSPPLTPNQATVDRRVGKARDSRWQVSRGISGNTLAIYGKAMAELPGPKYELISTVWGIDVEELSYYPQQCFDYVVVSSANSRRFRIANQAEEYPVSARFYREIENHSDYELVFSSHPEPWRIQGPSIDVYEVNSACN